MSGESAKSVDWPAFERYLVARRLAAGAIDGELEAGLDKARSERERALETAQADRDAALAESRRTVRLATWLTAEADRLGGLALRIRDGAGDPVLAGWQDQVSVSPDGSDVIGIFRLGRLSLSLPIEWTEPYLTAADLASIPALGSIVDHHLAIEGGPTDRAEELLRSVLLRLVLGQPSGDVRLILIDPTGSGQGLAAFRTLPAELSGGRVWVDPADIEAQLRNLSVTVEEILQARLGTRFASLAEYNAANAAVAEPYRVVAILGLPGGWTDRGLELLRRVARNGPRAGVHVLATLDRTAPVPRGVDLRDVLRPAASIVIDRAGEGTLDDPELGEVRFVPDVLPEAVTVERWLDGVANAFKDRSRALPAAAILPSLDWSASSADGLEVPIGLGTEGERFLLRLGDSPAHGLIGGMTGMGKTNLLHVLVAGLASRYSPDELELYLLDFKEGVGFAPYRGLPHARAVALETEREFALGVLRRLLAEKTRRSPLFQAAGGAGTDQFSAYRAAGGRLPRVVLLIDEFHVLLAGDDALARDTAAALEELVRQGRGFGLHVLLSSQSPSLAGSYLARLYNQMGLRVALKCRPADATAILGEGNDAAARLEEQGEAIVNAELGQPAGNRQVRVALLGREELAARIGAIAERDAGAHPGPVTFEGAAPARLEVNERLRGLWAGTWRPERGTAEAFLGEPVELKGPTLARFERYPRANLLVAGSDEEAAYGLLVAAAVSLALQEPDASFEVVELARPSSPVAGVFPELARHLGDRLAIADQRTASALLARLSDELQARLGAGADPRPPRYLVVTGLHRWRDLRGASQFDTSPDGASLLRLLEDGPDVGLHVIAWTDGHASLDRALKRGAAAAFDLRAILRVPENDSQNLIESTAAARLADNRAIFRSEEWPAGQLEKFKPYPVPAAEALAALLGVDGGAP